MSNQCKNLSYIIILIFMANFCHCSVENIAGGTEDVNTMIVIGKVLNMDSTAGSNSKVQLIPSNYNPVRDSKKVVQNCMTNSSGEYRFVLNKSGNYNVHVVHVGVQTRAIISNEKVQTDTTIFPSVVLSKPGKIKIALPDSANVKTGYMYIPGSLIFSHINVDSGYLVLDSVPSGAMYNIVYTSTPEAEPSVVRFDVSVESNEITTVSNTLWSYCKKIGLNTTAFGANVAGDVYEFPVLIRLNQKNFDFTQTNLDETDLIFTKKDNSLLPFEIERWDTVGLKAEIWVKIDTILGNNSDQYINMYWGDKTEPFTNTHKNGHEVFDTSLGFQGVWHFSESQSDTVYDATVNNFYGIFNGTQGNTRGEGPTGFSGKFDGVSNFVTMPLSANSKLNFPEDGIYSLSAWVHIDTLDNKHHEIVSKSNQLYGLQINNSNFVGFYEYSIENAWNVSGSQITHQQWHLVTGVRNGEKQYLYIDGVCVVDTIALIGGVRKRVQTEPLCIGNRVSTSEDGFFRGSIDEVRIHSKALSPDWIKLCFENQRIDDKFVNFR